MLFGQRNTLVRRARSFLNCPQYVNDLHGLVSPGIRAQHGLCINGKVIRTGLLGSRVVSSERKSSIEPQLVGLCSIHVYYKVE